MADELELTARRLRIGLLTTDDHDSWADARDRLLQIGGESMEHALEKIESGAFLLCLDHHEPLSARQCAESYWHGGPSSGHNRWFDKSIQIVCSENGKVGFVGEHSLMDGMPAVGLCAHILNTKYRDAAKGLPNDDLIQNQAAAGTDVDYIFKDCSHVESSIQNDIEEAAHKFAEMTTTNELSVQSFQAYGSNSIKAMGYSPDAFVQMAIQLATYRLFGKQCATYESTQVRPFLHGRTETTRSVSEASAAFVQRMGLRPMEENDEVSAKMEKKLLLSKAANSHVDFITSAARAMGVDRHFFGLSMLLDEGEEPPALFSDPLYLRSKTWRVSTSTLPNSPGFGPVVEDGVGVAYEVKPSSCVFTITCRREKNYSDALSDLLEEALIEMRGLHDATDDAEHPRSKL